MIRSLVASDLPHAVALLARVGLASGVTNLARYLTWQPDGAWVELDGDERVIGTVTVLRFGPVGFVGCMAVEPAMQGRGVGRRLLDHAHAASRACGVTTFLLEATTAGAPMYRRLGYVADYESVIVGRSGPTAVAAGSIAARVAEIVALDALATACDRVGMIGNLVRDHVGVVRDDGRGALCGYGLVVGERLGPVISRTADAGRAIVDQLAPACTVAAAPATNAAAIAALEANGFAMTRPITRMRLGPEVAVRPAWVFALASAGAG